MLFNTQVKSIVKFINYIRNHTELETNMAYNLQKVEKCDGFPPQQLNNSCIPAQLVHQDKDRDACLDYKE